MYGLQVIKGGIHILYLYAYVDTEMYFYRLIHVYLDIFKSECIHTYIYKIFIYIDMYIYTYICIYIYMYECIYIHINMYNYKYLYVYTKICIFTYVCIYLHINIYI
jgi:hypothetical protein